MPTEREKYLKLKADLEQLGPRVNALEKTAQQLQADAGPAEHEALKFEIAGDPRAAERQGAVRKTLSRTQEILADVDAGKKRIRATVELLPEFRDRARVEVLAECNMRLVPTVKTFAEKFRAAAAAEIALDGAQKELRNAFSEIDAPVPAQLEPAAPILMRDRSYGDIKKPWDEFLEKMKALGFDVD